MRGTLLILSLFYYLFVLVISLAYFLFMNIQKHEQFKRFQNSLKHNLKFIFLLYFLFFSNFGSYKSTLSKRKEYQNHSHNHNHQKPELSSSSSVNIVSRINVSLINGAPKAAHNRELDWYISFLTLYRGCTLYPRVVICFCLGPNEPLNTTKVNREGFTT